MSLLLLVRFIAIVCAGLVAGIYFGYRANAYYALQDVSASSFVQFQQLLHVHFLSFMPPLILTALLGALAWVVMIRKQWTSAEFWLLATSTCALALIILMTRAVNVPLNDQLMTWNIAAPPHNLREIWAPWDRVNTIRTVLAAGVLVLEALALSLRASVSRSFGVS